MGRLTVETAGRADARTGEFVEAFARGVEAMPPGQCPVGLVLGQLQASAAQTCGKCTPCAQGMPKLEALLREVAQFRYHFFVLSPSFQRPLSFSAFATSGGM